MQETDGKMTQSLSTTPLILPLQNKATSPLFVQPWCLERMVRW